MISLDRLQQIIPADQALANKALSVALQQITGINNTTLPVFSRGVQALQTTKDLPLISGLQQAVPSSVANYYINNLAIGTGANNTVQIVDIIGLAAGWVATDAFARTVEIFSTMDLSALSAIYQQMNTALSGGYGDTEAGPLIIPSGPAAGTYNGVEVDPGPPPEYDPTAADEAIAALTSAAQAEIANLQSAYPTQTSELNTLWNNMAAQVSNEDTLQTLIKLNYADLTANDRNSIYGFIFNLPSYGLQTQVGGVAWFLEAMANLATQGGQAVVACMREGRNQVALGNVGIYTNTKIPGDPIPPPPQADLLPSEYSEAEAQNLVIK